MSPILWFRNASWSLGIVLMMLMVATNASAEWKEKVLYSFQGGSDGSTPAGGVVFDQAGNLYGANTLGGSGGCPSPGCGTVFEVSPPTQKGGAWTETTIYAFQGVLGSLKDGFTPVGSVVIDQKGNLYGTTSLGGNGPCILLGSPTGCGTVYRLTPPVHKGGQWTETILHNFQSGTDGYFPWGDLVFDKNGNLYGATQFGGGKGTACNLYFGGNCGSVFKLSPPRRKGGAWTEKILHRFAGGTDGANPNGDLIFDGVEGVYGLTTAGGNKNCKYGSGQVGCGTAFKLKPLTKTRGTWSEQLLHSFDRTTADGGNPVAGLVFDSEGNLYGTTLNGGPGGGGIAFQISPPSRRPGQWKEVILYGFSKNGKGFNPESPLIFDSKGNLYGTANDSGEAYYGTVFRLSPRDKNEAWTSSLIYGFAGPPDGAQPAAGLVFDAAGNLYSTTTQGGTGACSGGCGTVFQVIP